MPVLQFFENSIKKKETFVSLYFQSDIKARIKKIKTS